MYRKIVNPKTGRKVNIDSQKGQQIIRNYIYELQGGGIDDGEERMQIKVKKKRLVIKKKKERMQITVTNSKSGEEKTLKVASTDIICNTICDAWGISEDNREGTEVHMGSYELDEELSFEENGVEDGARLVFTHCYKLENPEEDYIMLEEVPAGGVSAWRARGSPHFEQIPQYLDEIDICNTTLGNVISENLGIPEEEIIEVQVEGWESVEGIDHTKTLDELVGMIGKKKIINQTFLVFTHCLKLDNPDDYITLEEVPPGGRGHRQAWPDGFADIHIKLYENNICNTTLGDLIWDNLEIDEEEIIEVQVEGWESVEGIDHTKTLHELVRMIGKEKIIRQRFLVFTN